MAVVFLCTGGLGCAAVNIQKPTAAITAMHVQQITSQGFTMNFDVDLKNPNSIALPLTATDYGLGVGGITLLDGKADSSGSLPAQGSKTLTLPVTLTFEKLLEAEKVIRAGGGEIPYALEAGLTFDSGNPLLGMKRVPVKYSGTIELKELLRDPKVLLESPAAKKLAAMAIGRLLEKHAERFEEKRALENDK